MNNAKTTAEYLRRLGTKALNLDQPLKFPIKFKVFLRVLIGGRTHANRLVIFRKFCEEDARAVAWFSGNPQDKTEEAIQAAKHRFIEDLSKNGVSESRFNHMRNTFPKWRERIATEQRRNAAKKRWDKEKSKKGVALPRKPQK